MSDDDSKIKVKKGTAEDIYRTLGITEEEKRKAREYCDNCEVADYGEAIFWFALAAGFAAGVITTCIFGYYVFGFRP